MTGAYSARGHDDGADPLSRPPPGARPRPTKEVAMPTYISLIRYTERGVKTFKELSQRIEETKTAGESVGAKLIGYYLTMGQYDAVAITEAPDDHTIAKLALAAGGRGNVRTETMRAFTEEEAKKIAAELSES
jgi:uncharacterized protein with GYD domain